MIRRTLPSGRRLKVCIVGAGVAGLRAADRLLSHDIDVTVLEARDRVGGRMGQANLNGKLVDLGPNWIHGTKSNPILDIAHRTSTQLHSWEERQITFDIDGSQVSHEEVSETSDAFWSVVSDAFKYSREHSNSIDANRSLMDFVRERADLDYVDSDAPKHVKDRRRELLLHEALTWGGFVAGSTERQSLKFFWLEECIEGENPFVAETYKKVLDAIAEPVLARRDVLRLSTVVDGFTYDRTTDEVRVSIVDRPNQSFDEVIITTPLGWLKNNKTAFRPSLPERLDSAINAIGYGILDKVYITFLRPFWNEATNGLTASITSARSDEIPNTTATTAPLHAPGHRGDQGQLDLLDGGNEQRHPGFTHWYPPIYASVTNPKTFNQQAMNLAVLPPACAHPTLLFYIAGDCALHLSKMQTDAKSPAEAQEKLISFFGPYISLLPGYNTSDPACTPVDILATNWAADEYAGYGSYSNFQIGLEYGDKDIEVMREGMPDRRMWLAGEHTALFVALGTVTGAWQSGDAVAERLLKAYGLHDNAEAVEE